MWKDSPHRPSLTTSPLVRGSRAPFAISPCVYQLHSRTGSGGIPRKRVIFILRPFYLCDRKQRFEGFADTLHRYILHQNLPQTSYEGLSGFWCEEFGFADQVDVKTSGMFRFDSNEGRELADVNR